MHYSQSIYKTVFLSDIVDIQIGKTPSRNQKKYWGVGFPWVSISDLNGNEEINYTKEQITLEAINETGIKIVPRGTIIFSFKLSIGKVAITGQDIYTNEAIAAFKIKNSNIIDQRFLYYVLREFDFKGTGDKAVMGLTLNQKKLKELNIPLPPLSTQKKIAAILDKADALRQNDKKILEKYDQLAGSVFLEMFGDPVRNEKGWRIVLFGDIIEDIVGGKSFGGDYRSMKVGEMAVLKISSVTSGEFDSTQYKVVNEISSKINLIKPREGDLLFSRANTRELVGATCIVDKNYDQLFLPDKLWRLDLNQRLALNYYIKFLLSDTKFRGTLTKKATGTSGSMLNISKAKLRALPIPLPRLDLQTQFQASIKKIEEQKEYTRISLQKSEELFQSLLQRAFSGELG